jgi:hypothetical protein
MPACCPAVSAFRVPAVASEARVAALMPRTLHHEEHAVVRHTTQHCMNIIKTAVGILLLVGTGIKKEFPVPSNSTSLKLERNIN